MSLLQTVRVLDSWKDGQRQGSSIFANKINGIESWLHDSFDKNFTLVMRVPPLDEKTNTIGHGSYAKLMPGGHDDEYTADKEEESDQLVEDARTSVMVNDSTKTEAGDRKDPG